MEFVLADAEIEALRIAVKDRLDTLLMGLSNTDTLSAKTTLRSEIETLEGIYGQLGCTHETGTEGSSCTYVGSKDSPEAWMGDAD
jgi:hypothetical protein